MTLDVGMREKHPFLWEESVNFSSPAATAIVSALRARGFQMRVVDGRIGIRGEVSPELRSLIEQHRQAVILAVSPGHPEYWQSIVNAHGWDHAAAEWLTHNGCGRLISKLYRTSGRFRCRKCSKLVYDCQYENWVDRALRRKDKITRKLWIKREASPDVAERPKYMRRKMYDKLLCQLQIIEDCWET